MNNVATSTQAVEAVTSAATRRGRLRPLLALWPFAARYRGRIALAFCALLVAAHHIALEERVAVKLLRREVMRPDTIARFLREAKAAVKIKSEHVARVSDVGKLENGAPYMVMEYLEGSDLSGWLTERTTA